MKNACKIHVVLKLQINDITTDFTHDLSLLEDKQLFWDLLMDNYFQVDKILPYYPSTSRFLVFNYVKRKPLKLRRMNIDKTNEMIAIIWDVVQQNIPITNEVITKFLNDSIDNKRDWCKESQTSHRFGPIMYQHTKLAKHRLATKEEIEMYNLSENTHGKYALTFAVENVNCPCEDIPNKYWFF